MSNTASERSGSAQFSPADIDPFLCSHVILGYAAIKDNVLKETGPSDDGRSYYLMIVSLQTRSSCTKYSLSQNSSHICVKFYTVEVEMFALKNVCDFSNPANMKFFANGNYLRFFILFESL